MIEEWRPVEGFDGYEVSDAGNVRCSRPRGNQQAPVEPRPLKPKGRKSGTYLRVQIGKYGPTRTVHSLVADAFVEGKAPGLEVAHENGNKYDNRAENLRWKTRKENHADKFRHGTNGRGLTREVVEAIRATYVPGKTTTRQVAEMFGITPSTVCKIVKRQRWEYAA